MASPVESTIYIPKFTPIEVFRAGTLQESLPTENGLSIEADDEQFELGTPFRVGVKVANHNFQIPSSITEYEPAERVTIFGKSKIGDVTIGLALSSYEDEEQDGTKVDYSILVNHSFMYKLAEPLVKEHLNKTLPRYTEKHKKRVVELLNASSVLATLLEV